MSNSARLWLGVVAVIALAIAGSPAQAGIWNATYDPPAYIGTGTFDVPDVCLSSDGDHVQSEFVGCAIQIAGNVSTVPGIDFAPILPLALCSSCVYDVIGGALAGINTGVIGSVNVGDVDYWFEFLATFHPGDGPSSPPSVTNAVNLYTGCVEVELGVFIDCSTVNAATTVAFAKVPEPDSLALILGALGTGWLVRRRRSAI
jgi:hypothetical protein